MRKRKARDESRTSIAEILLLLLIVVSMVGLVYLIIVVYIAPPSQITQKPATRIVAHIDTFDKEDMPSDQIKRDFPVGDYSDTGNGTFYVSTQSGTSEDGSVPSVLVDTDTTITQIGYGSTEIDGSKITYIYIDGILKTKGQISDSQGALDIKGELLKTGTHKVEVVQYDTDDPTGSVVTYKAASYEVKN